MSGRLHEIDQLFFEDTALWIIRLRAYDLTEAINTYFYGDDDWSARPASQHRLKPERNRRLYASLDLWLLSYLCDGQSRRGVSHRRGDYRRSTEREAVR